MNTIKYKDEEIILVGDEWACHNLGIRDPSLAVVKGWIDKRSAAERRMDVPALAVNREYDRRGTGFEVLKIERVTITVVCEPRTNRFGALRDKDNRDVWVTGPEEKRGNTIHRPRYKIALDRLYPVSAEADLAAAILRLNRIEAEQIEAQRSLDAIEGMNMDKLGELRAELAAEKKRA